MNRIWVAIAVLGGLVLPSAAVAEPSVWHQVKQCERSDSESVKCQLLSLNIGTPPPEASIYVTVRDVAKQVVRASLPPMPDAGDLRRWADARTDALPAGVASLTGDETPTSVKCDAVGKTAKTEVRRWCVVRFGAESRAFLLKQNGWVEHPVGLRREGSASGELVAVAASTPAPLDCGQGKSGSKRAVRQFFRILRTGDEAKVLDSLATNGRFEWITALNRKNSPINVRGDRRAAAAAIARYGGLPLRVTEFMNIDEPSGTMDFGFFGTWNGKRMNGKGAIDCNQGKARVLSVALPSKS